MATLPLPSACLLSLTYTEVSEKLVQASFANPLPQEEADQHLSRDMNDLAAKRNTEQGWGVVFPRVSQIH